MVALDGSMQRKELLFWINLWRLVSPSHALYTVLSIDVGSHKGMDVKKNWLEMAFYICSDLEPQSAYNVATCGNVWRSRFQGWYCRIRNKVRGTSELLDGYLSIGY